MSMRDDLRFARAPMAAFVANGVCWGAFAALVPQIKGTVGLSDGGFGTVMFVAASGAVLAMWLAPWIDSKLGKRAMTVLAIVLALVFSGVGLSTTAIALAVVMTAVSVSSGTLDVIMNTRISALEGAHGRPLMSLAHGVFSFGYAGSAMVAGLMREAGAATLVVMVFVALVVAGLAYIASGDTVDETPDDPDAPKVSLPWHILVPGGLIILIAFMTEQSTEGWSALYLERSLGAGAATGALGPAILGLTMGIGRFSGQLLAARFSEAQVIAVGATLAAVGSFLAATAGSLIIAYIGFAALGFGISVIAPMAYAWIGKNVTDRERTLAISRMSVIGYSGFFIGPPMMGFLAEGFGLSTSFVVLGVLLAFLPLVLVPLLVRNAKCT